MDILFALDVKHGSAVHGIRGDRKQYRRPMSPLAADPRPASVLSAVRDHTGIERYYVADLDMIEKRSAPGSPAVLSLPRECPWASVWLDVGVSEPEKVKWLLDIGFERVVIGLETLPNLDRLQPLYQQFGNRIMFSLDLRAGVPITPNIGLHARSPEAILMDVAEMGAADAIVLDVALVGSREGHDERKMARLQRWNDVVPLYVAGGVSRITDIMQLEARGIRGVIVATAIYDGIIERSDVTGLTEQEEYA